LGRKKLKVSFSEEAFLNQAGLEAARSLPPHLMCMEISFENGGIALLLLPGESGA
jgi:hypothetical protein